MITLYTVLFIIFSSIYGITAIYTKILLEKNGFNITYFYTEISDYKNLWILGKKQTKYKLLFIIYISSTILLFTTFFLIAIS